MLDSKFPPNPVLCHDSLLSAIACKTILFVMISKIITCNMMQQVLFKCECVYIIFDND